MTHIEQRHDLSTTWTSENPVLYPGEVGWEEDTNKSKLGDGLTAWNDLPYTAAGIDATADDVGLGNVDDTSDMDKPISTATQVALDLKADQVDLDDAVADIAALDAAKAPLASPVFTGNPQAPTPSTSDDDTSVATTEFVKDALAAVAAPDVQIFTSDGTWNKPAGAKFVVVEAVGGGGSGGSCGAVASAQCAHAGGGGAGAYAWKKLLASSVGSSVTVDVGAFGAAPAAGANNGNSGAQSSFGTHVVAPGGSGGVGSASNAADYWIPGGDGGTSSGAVGDLIVPGAPGHPGNGNGSLAMGGQGGSGRFGAGGSARTSGSAGQSIAGMAGQGRGSGGSGAMVTSAGAAAAGGAGAPGLVIVTTYFA